MKYKYVSFAFILILGLNELSFPQTDSSLLQYFPLHKGNLWQYRYRTSIGGGGWLVNMVSYGDTIMPNGLKYVKAVTAPYEPRLKYYRIDSSYRVQEYFQRVGDTCGGLNQELNVFRLNEYDSLSWKICYNISENILPPVIRYIGVFKFATFNKVWDIKLFKQYHKFYDSPSGDTIEMYGTSYFLMRGIGIYYTEWGEESNATLTGAIINGVRYGNIVGVFDEKEKIPQSFVLNQNYPNPFNSETIISFTIGKTQHVKMEVYNTLGQLVTLLENNVLNSGIHARVFYAQNIPSGIYYVRLQTNNQTAIKKMMYIK